MSYAVDGQDMFPRSARYLALWSSGATRIRWVRFGASDSSWKARRMPRSGSNAEPSSTMSTGRERIESTLAAERLHDAGWGVLEVPPLEGVAVLA